jgi:hypothetical protein
MEAPTATELAAVPEVIRALEAAWRDSLSDDDELRHEEGGWIYFNPKSGEYLALRGPPGARRGIELSAPHELYGYYVVGKFHTHPNPSAEGWDTGPSYFDRKTDDEDGVPDLIRADDGLHTSGPPRRRGGLTGRPGYPE